MVNDKLKIKKDGLHWISGLTTTHIPDIVLENIFIYKFILHLNFHIFVKLYMNSHSCPFKVEYQVVRILVKQIGFYIKICGFNGTFCLINCSKYLILCVFFIMKWVLVANFDYRSLNKNKPEIASDYFLK